MAFPVNRLPWAVTLISLLASMALVLSCSSPESSEQFVRTGKTDIEGSYSFEADFEEGNSYDLDLYVNMVCGNVKFAQFPGISLSLLWESPQEEKFSEDVFISRENLDKDTYFVKSLVARYREDLMMDPAGKWGLTIGVPGEMIEHYGITGIGLRVTRR